MNNADAIHAALVADAGFLAAVGRFGGQPSVFVGDVIGSGVKAAQHGPYVIIRDAPLADDDTGLDLRRQVQRVFFYGQPEQAVDALARAGRQLLHRIRANTDDGPIVGSTASGPVDAPTSDPALIGRLVTVAFLKQE